jgi:hypothetical protein
MAPDFTQHGQTVRQDAEQVTSQISSNSEQRSCVKERMQGKRIRRNAEQMFGTRKVSRGTDRNKFRQPLKDT